MGIGIFKKWTPCVYFRTKYRHTTLSVASRLTCLGRMRAPVAETAVLGSHAVMGETDPPLSGGVQGKRGKCFIQKLLTEDK